MKTWHLASTTAHIWRNNERAKRAQRLLKHSSLKRLLIRTAQHWSKAENAPALERREDNRRFYIFIGITACLLCRFGATLGMRYCLLGFIDEELQIPSSWNFSKLTNGDKSKSDSSCTVTFTFYYESWNFCFFFSWMGNVAQHCRGTNMRTAVC